MTTIIIIVVVALVFFVTICVVTFMVWKRETEMRTDSIKAIENNLEEVLYELSNESSPGIRDRKKALDGDEEQNELQKPNDRGITRSRSLDPFSWVRAEIEKRREQEAERVQDEAAQPGSIDDVKELEVNQQKADENELTVFDPDAKERALELERKRAAEARRRNLKWVEVQEDAQAEAQGTQSARETSLPEASEALEALEAPAAAEPAGPEASETPAELSGAAEFTKTIGQAEGTERSDAAEAVAPAEGTASMASVEQAEPTASIESDDPLDLDGPPDLGTLEDLIELTKPQRTESSERIQPAEAADRDDASALEIPDESRQTGFFYENLQDLYGLLQNLEQPVKLPDPVELPDPAAPADPVRAAEPAEHSEPTEHSEPAEHTKPAAYDDPEDAMEDLDDTGVFQWITKPKTGYNIGKSGKEYTVSELEALIKE